jgi:hypothetical protein
MKRWFVLSALALAFVVPAVMASGQSDSGIESPFDTVGELILHLDGADSYFEYAGARQYITEARCEIGLVPPGETAGFVEPFAELVALDQSSDRGAGSFDDAIGVKSGGAQGVDCSRVDDGETLVLEFVDTLSTGGAAPLSGLSTAIAELDVEAKQDAAVVATTYFNGELAGVYELRTGGAIIPGEGTDPDPATPWLANSTAAAPVANCSDRSDSGSDSGANDNCRWVITAGIPFDEIHLSANSGEFSLEGGADGTPSNPTSDFVGPESVFYLTDIDGILDCGDTVSVGDGITTPQGIITRLNYFTTPECVLKPYTLESTFSDGEQQISFAPDGDVVARYSAALTFLPELATNPLSQVLQYDPEADGTFVDMQWCEDSTITQSIGTAGELVRTATSATLPGGESWCIAAVDGLNLATSQVQLTWWVYGEDDPKFKVR